MKLSRLTDAFAREGSRNAGYRVLQGRPEMEITSLHYRAQEVERGGLFVAIPGTRRDGHDFIDEALRRGALAIVTQRPWTVADESVAVVQVVDSREALAALSAVFYGDPSSRLCLIGITGTNGKTTTSYLVEGILEADGRRTGVIGTIDYRFGGRSHLNPVTTPESSDLQAILKAMADSGVTHAVVEVSSHALDLGRVLHCLFDVVVFTNLTQDHLDYHQDMETYWECKRRLFTDCQAAQGRRKRAWAVVNGDDPRGTTLCRDLSLPLLCTGVEGEREIQAHDVEIGLEGTTGTLEIPGGIVRFASPLVGRHNLHNIMSAAGVAVALGIEPEVIERGIARIPCVPGRLERVRNRTGRSVFVDYAHTPDALQNVLGALRHIATGRIITVFGCGGERDRTKRAVMGEVVGRMSDFAVVTSDNPRGEDPEAIIRDIIRGMPPNPGSARMPHPPWDGTGPAGWVVEPNRRLAIERALVSSRAGDTILIAGKGHETYQIVGQKKLPFDDRKVAADVLAQLEKAEGTL